MQTVYRNELVLTIGAPSIGAIETRGLAVEVALEVGKPGRSSSGEVVIYNLADRTRAALAEAGSWLSVAAVRDGVRSELVTRADVARVVAELSGRDLVTTCAIDTGRRALSRRVSVGFPPGARLRVIVAQLAASAGLPLAHFSADLEAVALSAGWSYMGTVSGALWDVTGSTGAVFRIIGGGLYVMPEGGEQRAIARRFAPGAGLIGSPAVGDRGEVDLSVELDTALTPGDYFEIRSRFVNGAYRAREVSHVVSTIGAGEWTTSIKGAPL